MIIMSDDDNKECHGRGYVNDYEYVVGGVKVDYYDDYGIVVIRNCSKIHSR